MDPAARADFMAVERYSKEVWLPTETGWALAPSLLEEAHKVAMSTHVGPLWTVARALDAAEWVFESWHEFRRRDGVIMNLHDSSPGMVRKYYMEDLREKVMMIGGLSWS